MSTTITSTKQFDEFTAATKGTLVVDFWAEWCGPCRAVGPILEDLEKYEGITVAKVNVDDQPELAARFQVTSIPLMHVYSDGKKSPKDILGARPKAQLVDAIVAAIDAS
jgi:thioredoxin 1